MSSDQPSVFIGYRREDSGDTAGRIFDVLEPKFGRGRVFKDVDSIPVGMPFPQYVPTVVAKCQLFLALIGPKWVSVVNGDGGQRLYDDEDLVRIEIETALATPGVQIVPILLNGASMPKRSEIPPTLHPLLIINAAKVRPDPDFRTDMNRLVRALEASKATGIVKIEREEVAPPSTPARTGFDPKRYVFISYPDNIDENLLRAFVREILRRGIGVWIYDPSGFGFTDDELAQMRWQESGGSWLEQTLKAAERAPCVVALINEHSLQSRFQPREYELAAQKGTLVPCLIDDILSFPDLPEWLRNLHVPRISPAVLNSPKGRDRVAMFGRDVEGKIAKAKRPARKKPAPPGDKDAP